MLYVDENHYDQSYFECCFSSFAVHPQLARIEGQRIAVRLTDRALWLALCLYARQRSGTLFPLAVDTPLDACRRRAERSGCRWLIFGDGSEALDALQAIGSPESDATGEAALIQTSSGTTGEPKFIERSWSSIATEVEAYVRHFDGAEGTTPVVACPINHSYGLISGVLAALKRGVEPRIVTNPNPKYLLRKCAEVEAPLLYASPTLLATVAMLTPEERPLHAAMTSGTLLQRNWFDGIRKKVRHLHQQYGCSEAGCISLGEDIDEPNQLGRPLPHIELVAGSSADEPGEIIARSTEGRIIATRDLGYLADGHLHFVSRLDDMINVSGLNVYPSEVEEVVLELPDVTEAVVYKRRHGFGSDQVSLRFVAARTLAPEHVREWCSARLASHQVPMHVTQVPTIPKLPNGKTSRNALAEADARGEFS